MEHVTWLLSSAGQAVSRLLSHCRTGHLAAVGDYYILLLLAVALFPSLCWLLFFWSCEGEYRRPIGAVARAFYYGALLLVPAVLLELWPVAALRKTMPAFLVPLLVFAGGLVEEFLKYLAAGKAIQDGPGLNRPSGGITYAAAAALGFAGMENVCRLRDLNLTQIGCLSVGVLPMQVLFSVFWGSALGRRRCAVSGTSGWAIARGLAYAGIAHGLYDYLVLLSKTRPDVAVIGIFLLAIGLMVKYRNQISDDIALGHGRLVPDRSATGSIRTDDGRQAVQRQSRLIPVMVPQNNGFDVSKVALCFVLSVFTLWTYELLQLIETVVRGSYIGTRIIIPLLFCMFQNVAGAVAGCTGRQRPAWLLVHNALGAFLAGALFMCFWPINAPVHLAVSFAVGMACLSVVGGSIAIHLAK